MHACTWDGRRQRHGAAPGVADGSEAGRPCSKAAVPGTPCNDRCVSQHTQQPICKAAPRLTHSSGAARCNVHACKQMINVLLIFGLSHAPSSLRHVWSLLALSLACHAQRRTRPEDPAPISLSARTINDRFCMASVLLLSHEPPAMAVGTASASSSHDTGICLLGNNAQGCLLRLLGPNKLIASMAARAHWVS